MDSVLLLVDMQEKLVPLVLNQDSLVSRCHWLLKLAAQLHVPVVTSEQYPKGLGPTIARLSSAIPHQKIIEKVHFSCMQEPNYVQILRQQAKNQLVFCGIEAHVCVLQTALESKTSGFDVFVVVDAVSSRSELDYNYGLTRMKQAGIHLITTEMVFFEWLRQSGFPNFKELSKEFIH
jgi:nicotinamidase-related amidase